MNRVDQAIQQAYDAVNEVMPESTDRYGDLLAEYPELKARHLARYAAMWYSYFDQFQLAKPHWQKTAAERQEEGTLLLVAIGGGDL